MTEPRDDQPAQPSRPNLLLNRFVQALACMILSAIVYAVGLRYISLGDTIPAEYLPISILKEGDFDFDEFGWTPQNLPYFFVERKGRIIDFYPIVPGLLNVPAFAIGQWLGMDLLENRLWLSMWTCIAISSASVGLIYLALSWFCNDRRSAGVVTLVYALGTIVWSVTSRCLWQHGPSLLFLTGALACLMSGRAPIVRKSPRLTAGSSDNAFNIAGGVSDTWISWVALSGLFLGMAVWNRPTNVLFAFPLAVYVTIYHRKAIPLFLLAAAIPAVCMTWYATEYWGEFWSLGQGHRPGMAHGGHAIAGFSGAFWPAMMGHLFSPARGIFIFSPVLSLGLLYLPRAVLPKRSHPILPFVVVGVMADLCLYSKWTVWWGGHSFSYRMIIETVPGLMLLLAGAWETIIARRWWLQALFWPMLGWSIFCHYLGAFYYPDTAWNYQPVNVDYATERLWNVKDSELMRDFHTMQRDMEER